MGQVPTPGPASCAGLQGDAENGVSLSGMGAVGRHDRENDSDKAGWASWRWKGISMVRNSLSDAWVPCELHAAGHER